MTGVEIDPADPTSASGLRPSGDLSRMLPSEAVLLRSSLGTLRRLFLARKAESSLLGYEMSGWADVPTSPPPPPRRRRRRRLPSSPGGPIVVCLDTSHSMSTGSRETISKSIVLASAMAARAQGRECRVVSFSSRNNAVEVGEVSCDADGVRRLLDFLSYSFGGGTDVTGALRVAVSAHNISLGLHLHCFDHAGPDLEYSHF